MRNKKSAFKAIAKFAFLLIILLGIPAYIYFFNYDVISGFRSLDDVKNYLEQYERASIFIYIGLQIIQIIISLIPGQAVQFAAGYLYGFWFGYIISVAGISLGTMGTFYLARLLGKDAMYLFFGEEKFTEILNRLNSRRALMIIFILYLIPGLPKDLVGYAAGLSKMKFFPFLVLSLIGRTPALMGSILIGSMVDEKNYISVIVLSAVFIVLFLIAFIKRKAIMTWFDL